MIARDRQGCNGMLSSWNEQHLAIEARQAGDLQRSVAFCHARLTAEPNDPVACALIAANLAEMDKLEQAKAFLQRALALHEQNGLVQLYASMVFEAGGDAQAALDAARLACALRPDLFAAQGRLGDLAGRLDLFDEAYRALKAALAINPDHPGVRLRFAGACMVVEAFDDAQLAIKGLSGPILQTPEALRVVMALSHQRTDWSGMVSAAKALLAQLPDDEEAVSALAHGLGQQGYYQKATELFRPVAQARNDAASWTALGRFRIGARDLDDARNCFERALRIEPDHAEALFGMARYLTFSGDMPAAEQACRDALSADPNFLEAFGQLCEVSGGRLSDEEIDRLAGLCDDETLPDDKRVIGLFALGDAQHRRKHAAAAFSGWDRANALRVAMRAKAQDDYSAEGQETGTGRLMEYFPAPVLLPVEDDDPITPIFIVGMPRSGTTLLETIISAHSDVAPAGELPAMPYLLQQMLGWARQNGWSGGMLPEDVRQDLRRRYFEQYASFNIDTDVRYVTDKQPSNVFAVGLIAQLFPKSPILHIRRNPVETGFSIFRRNFSRQWPFADRQEDIAHYYGQYARIAEHWDVAMPGRMHFLQYEQLIDDFDAKVREVVDACGLELEQACLEFWKIERPVMTFSATQVRKPPSSDHKSSTGDYREFLGPMEAALISYGIDIATGGFDRSGLAMPDGRATNVQLRPPETASDNGGSERQPAKPGGLMSKIRAWF